MSTPKARLHRAAVADGDVWHSLPPHVPGSCAGRYGTECPQVPNVPCEHKHRTSRAAFQCSAGRPVAVVTVPSATPRRPHAATYAPEDGGGYLVTCPEGCSLGTSEHQPDEAGALRRVHLHKIATERLG